jgi:hypothetical protein
MGTGFWIGVDVEVEATAGTLLCGRCHFLVGQFQIRRVERSANAYSFAGAVLAYPPTARQCSPAAHLVAVPSSSLS